MLYSVASEDQALWAPTRPKLYVIDSSMQIQQVLYGAVTEDSLRSILSELSDG